MSIRKPETKTGEVEMDIKIYYRMNEDREENARSNGSEGNRMEMTSPLEAMTADEQCSDAMATDIPCPLKNNRTPVVRKGRNLESRGNGFTESKRTVGLIK